MNEFMQIDKLNNSNYASWLDDIKVVLMEKNLWRITEESEVSPDEALFPKEYNEFQVRKNKAYATIYLSIEKEYRILISEVDDSPQAWKILQKHFRPDSRARVISLTDEFFSCKISEDEDIGLFAARLKKIIIDLKDAGKPIADWYQAFQNEQLNCEVCKLAKTKRKSFKPIGKIKSTKPLQLLHMDVCGPLPSQSLRGHRYFLSITDDYSRKVIVYPMKNKSEVFDCFTKFQKRAERYLNSKIINIRTDRGMEFCHNEFQNFLDNQGIRAERTNEYTPEQNGVSERFNYTALDAVKCLLKDSNLRNGFWAEALLCFTYTWNRICHQSHNKTPFELYCGRKPSIRHLKPFGATAYIGTPRQLRTKLQMRAKKGVMVGYAMQTKGYRIWLPAERKIIETINVTFDNGFNSGKALDPNDSKFYISKESNSDLESEIPITGEILEDVKVKSEFSGDPNTEEFEPDSKSNLLKRVTWSRQAVPRKDGSRTDIYYRIEGTNTRFRSHNDVKTYCELNGIEYNEGMFNFSGKDPYSGDVKYNEENSNTNI
ncbi:Retrovirus-related Pol polyprotein from transposon TNT 1-94 [Araneus ventricosus]|uniref:Retrovirus-related Pol polyprotein from transposon TNT 1-94 n=1 Tax=Araneus ventricosus TaxID=182803 RepID=A0A4Y2QLM4_ARAVE|nr:Retrovirus-related Pol polyprotein from transposon TNT 1-94 [Araneus ventricosus]GBN64188.1 Retrovirus-related Pol polyprotein from transposon TNT 1-94 [Araneus ventricosus]